MLLFRLSGVVVEDSVRRRIAGVGNLGNVRHADFHAVAVFPQGCGIAAVQKAPDGGQLVLKIVPLLPLLFHRLRQGAIVLLLQLDLAIQLLLLLKRAVVLGHPAANEVGSDAHQQNADKVPHAVGIALIAPAENAAEEQGYGHKPDGLPVFLVFLNQERGNGGFGQPPAPGVEEGEQRQPQQIFQNEHLTLGGQAEMPRGEGGNAEAQPEDHGGQAEGEHVLPPIAGNH